MIKYWRDSPEPIRRQVARALAVGANPTDEWIEAATLAWACGYDIDRPPQTATQRLVELRRTDPRSAGEFTGQASVALETERRALALYESRRWWAQTATSPCELRERREAEETERTRVEAVERRAVEINAERERGEHDKRMAAARRASEKELA